MKGKKTPRTTIIEAVGYVCLDFVRGEDLWESWHEETCYCHAETMHAKPYCEL